MKLPFLILLYTLVLPLMVEILCIQFSISMKCSQLMFEKVSLFTSPIRVLLSQSAKNQTLFSSSTGCKKIQLQNAPSNFLEFMSHSLAFNLLCWNFNFLFLNSKLGKTYRPLSIPTSVGTFHLSSSVTN